MEAASEGQTGEVFSSVLPGGVAFLATSPAASHARGGPLPLGAAAMSSHTLSGIRARKSAWTQCADAVAPDLSDLAAHQCS